MHGLQGRLQRAIPSFFGRGPTNREPALCFLSVSFNPPNLSGVNSMFGTSIILFIFPCRAFWIWVPKETSARSLFIMYPYRAIKGLIPTSVIITRESPPLYGVLVFGKPFLWYHRSGFHVPQPCRVFWIRQRTTRAKKSRSDRTPERRGKTRRGPCGSARPLRREEKRPIGVKSSVASGQNLGGV